MSDTPQNPADLSALGIDLSQLFRPAWTQESEDVAGKYAGFDGEDRPGRDRRGPRRDRPERGSQRSGERRSGAERGPRPERSAPERREGGQGSREDRRGPARGSGRGGGDRRGPRDRRTEQAPPPPKPALEGWSLDLVPETAAIDGIARQIRSRAKAYPLFELARLIVRLSDRYSVLLKPLSPGTTSLIRVALDGSLWQSRRDAAAHLLSRHRERFYRKTTLSVEPPKGAFSVVAQCGMSGVVIGPPNHHEYTTKVIALHASRFRNLPFDVFKSRIRMVRDEALIEQWKTEQSTRTVFVPLTEEEILAGPKTAGTEEASPVAEEPSRTATETTPAGEIPAGVDAAPDVETPEAREESPSPISGIPESSPEASPDTELSPESTEGIEEAAPESTAESSETTEPAAEPLPVDGLTEEELTAHFLQHHGESLIEEVSSDISLAGKTALHGSTPLLRELLISRLQELDRFPLPLAQQLGRDLSAMGLQIFKSHRKIIHVSVARPRYLDRNSTPIGDSLKGILEYLEAHPNQNRDKQWAALLRLRTETAGPATVGSSGTPGTEISPAESLPPETSVIDTPVSEEAEPLSPEPADAPASTSSPSALESTTPTGSTAREGKPRPEAPDEETLRKREQALAADILWLLHQGHVIDFAMGNLQAATKPAPRPEPKPKKGLSAETQTGGEKAVDRVDEAAAEESSVLVVEVDENEILTLKLPDAHSPSAPSPEGSDAQQA